MSGRTEEDVEVAAFAPEWVTLQRAVAVGMVILVTLPMVFVAAQPIPPLVVAGVLFACGLVGTWVRPRISSMTVGTIAAVWLLLQFVNASRVLAGLADPSSVASFVATLGMVVLPAAGTVGLVGSIRRTPASVAVRTMLTAGTVMAVGLGVAVAALLAT